MIFISIQTLASDNNYTDLSKKNLPATAYRRSWPVYRLSGPVNRDPQAANRLGPIDLLPARLTVSIDHLAERRGRLAVVGRRTGRPGGGQQRLRGERTEGGASEAAGYWGRLTGCCRAMGLNVPAVFFLFLF